MKCEISLRNLFIYLCIHLFFHTHICPFIHPLLPSFSVPMSCACDRHASRARYEGSQTIVREADKPQRPSEDSVTCGRGGTLSPWEGHAPSGKLRRVGDVSRSCQARWESTRAERREWTTQAKGTARWPEARGHSSFPSGQAGGSHKEKAGLTAS